MQILTTVLTALMATAFAATIPNTGDGANAAGGIQIDCYKKCNDYYNNCLTSCILGFPCLDICEHATCRQDGCLACYDRCG
ncbi:hypothetical protein W97_08716 [Coniosporium apollinis CBS 100218]|uniref:Uncharacterized protein n=1 Tax=Coniosporium apollinis (strain CBS 100218) TaxID=1168221 RepID=R7Z695_CONA1|nr:uncharacterized protein W97_08716 [Coniosporium apollinis CBS 100218]EON69456.1 hypothetical protein W97_08716 [Coniosporium apollinis CBS 100218]